MHKLSCAQGHALYIAGDIDFSFVIPNVSIYLPYQYLYVALSRGVSGKTTCSLAKPNKYIDNTGKRTKSIVYRDILEDH